MHVTTPRVFFLAFSAVYALGALADPPVQLCAGKQVEISERPLILVEGGKLTQLLERKLKKPVTYQPGSYRNIDLLPGKKSRYQFPYPGELFIFEESGVKRIVHNHHVSTDGRYLPSINGWWVIEVEPSGKTRAIGFNETFCYFSFVYEPNK